MKKILIVILAAAALALLAWPRLAPLVSPVDPVADGERPGGAAPVVRTLRLEPQPFESRLTFNGTLMADRAINIRSELRGKVESIHFRDGQDVDENALIVVIEAGELAAELRSLTEQLALASTNEDRLSRLFERGSVTASERDDAVSRRAVLQAEVDRLQIRLSKTRIHAPFAGTLGLRDISQGDLIEADTLITTLQTVSDLIVDFSVPERYRAVIEPGKRLSLKVAGYEQPFEARVRAIDPRVDLATRTLTVRANVANPERRLLPGNYARVQFISRNEAALVVPAIAVLQSLDSVSVFTVKDGIAVRREVETGNRDASHVEILQGLEAGEVIITSGIQSVRDGQAVDVLSRVDLG